jgi:hypothetical protein
MYLYLSYIIYFCITYYITFYIGRECYRNGYYYILELYDHNHDLSISVNKMLLVGYYLVNFGFILHSLSCWTEIVDFEEMIEFILPKIGAIMLVLSFLHFGNIFSLIIFKKYFSTPKSKSINH